MTTETLPAVAVPLEPTTPIKPSELLRLGRMLVPGRSVYALVRTRKGTVVAACAMGAMAVAAGVEPAAVNGAGFWWPGGFDSAPRVQPPCVCPPEFLNRLLFRDDRLPGPRVMHRHRAWRAPAIVAHLSDHHGGRGGHSRLGDHWPTARIADWLAEQGL